MLEQLMHSAKVVKHTITVEETGLYRLQKDGEPNFLRIRSIALLREKILQIISDRLWELTSQDVARAAA